MTLSTREIAALKVRAWKNRAKGKSVRWRMLRDTVSVVSEHWMTGHEIESAMIRIWGLTRKKTRELIEELVEIGDLSQEKDDKTHDMKYHLPKECVPFWFGPEGIKAIPAGIVQAVRITRRAYGLEG